MPVIKADTLKDHIGQEIGVSDWIEIDQSRIDVFADVTEDHQFIHIDPERAAKETPFGGTIAHGFLSLSMLSALAANTTLVLDGIAMGINYGFDKVRFLQPVRAGKKIRGRFVLEDATERNPGQWMLKYAVTVEIEGEEKPALMAHWLTLQIVG
ncbi:MaoC family dehydratase [Maricaulis sp.]|jgi:acyl dehydratase|uniref:MaoC family dehydratase n=1 Tax=Maricaulis sp. TaxID=1486257 RepID=UPI003299AC30